MSDVRATADTNVLASGAPHARPDAAPVLFLTAWENDQFSLVLSDHILDELQSTLERPYFAARLTDDDRRDFLERLRREAMITSLGTEVQGVASHPEDDLVLATAVSGNAQYLVTGDHRLLALKEYAGVAIVSVHAFLDLLPGLGTS